MLRFLFFQESSVWSLQLFSSFRSALIIKKWHDRRFLYKKAVDYYFRNENVANLESIYKKLIFYKKTNKQRFQWRQCCFYCTNKCSTRNKYGGKKRKSIKRNSLCGWNINNWMFGFKPEKHHTKQHKVCLSKIQTLHWISGSTITKRGDAITKSKIF